MRDKLNFDEYFSDKEIIKYLCQKRAHAAKKVHDNHFYRNISKSAVSPHKYLNKKIYSFFPPRNQWIRINKRERRLRGSNSIETNSIQLERTVWREKKKFDKLSSPKPIWIVELNKFIRDIQTSVFDEKLNYTISSPRIIPVLKDEVKCTYRPISLFSLKDLLITGQVARYLSNCFDPLFSDSSYAFRTNIQKNKTFNHHKSIENIIKFKTDRIGNLFVSECDLKKFYDCVNHSVVYKHFDLLVGSSKKKLDIVIEERAKFFFNSYLNSFSFNDNIKSKESQLLQQLGISKGTIPWVEKSELIAVNSNPDEERIGVPQGGAISCLIANILLNHVDQKINTKSDINTFYARFCDDMILINSDKDKCLSLLKEYQLAVNEVKLIYHKPKKSTQYNKEFWNSDLKSKLPYSWSKYDKKNVNSYSNVPWLSFVGYQIRYDGLVRVRKKSIRKELVKQVSETDKIIKVIKKNTRINKRAIRFRLQQRLFSMSVSRFRFGSNHISMCWCAGFRILKTNKNVTNQIRSLDRNRDKQLRRLYSKLKRINTPSNQREKDKQEVIPLKFYGHNYSYHKQFENQHNT